MHRHPLRGLAIGAALVACAGGGEVGSDHGARSGDPARIGTTSSAMTVDEILARADEYVAANVPYCGGVRGGTDYICGGTCERPAAAWDHYRSDCSGFVSWCWQVASDPTTDGYMNDTSGPNGWFSVGIDELVAGDAVVCDGHIKLFSKFVGSGQAEIYEEYNCGHTARKAVQTFTRSGDTIRFAYDSRVYHGIRRNGLTAAVVVKGSLDVAGSTIDGWAVDMTAPAKALVVDAYVDGDAAKGFHLQGKADVPRPDVAKSIGVDPNHGFSIPTPLYFCDGKDHALTVLGEPAAGGAPSAIRGAATSLSCAVPPAIQGVLRHVVDPTSLEAWKLDVHASLRWVTPEDRAAYAASADLPAKPEVGRTSDGRAWVVDSGARRLVADARALAAWGFEEKAVGALSAEDCALPEGLPLPVRPVLVQAVGAPAVYVLDVDPAHPKDDPGSDDPVYMTTTGKRRFGADTAAGCAITGVGAPRGQLGSLVALVAVTALLRRRRAAA